MIVLHEQHMIFLKTRKTAGTSLEIALSSLAGPGDIVTRLIPEDEDARFRATAVTPRNHMVPLLRYRYRDLARLVAKRTRPSLTSHSPAERVKAAVGERVWRTYFKFAVERNPFDRIESLYWWVTRSSSTRPTLHEFVRTLPETRLSNYPIYSIGDVYAVDRLLRYEDLEAELQRLEVDRGITLPELPRAKSAVRPTTMAPHCLDPGTRDLIAKACRREIALLGYTPAGANSGDTEEHRH